MMDNGQAVQAIFTVGVPTLAVLVGILVNNSRLSDLRSYMDWRFESMNQRFESMDKRFESMDKRFDSMERRSDQRFEDLKETWRAELHRVEEVLDARLKHLEHEA
jgi:chaperonin cofactor prefoldin